MIRPNVQAPRWRRAPEARPAQIIEAALEVFGEVGLARARLDDIAKRAGISKGTIYVYFPDKEALFKEVVRKTVISTIERAERNLTAETATEQLTGYMRGYWQFLRSPAFAAIYRLVIGELRNFPDLATFYSTEVIARGLRLVSGIIQRGIDSGEFRPMNAEVAARGLAGMLIAHAIWCGDRECFGHVANKSDEEILEELTDLFLHAIRAT
jgi:AcrR family transcriptional regulator